MTILYLWLLIGLIGFCTHLYHDIRQGQEITLKYLLLMLATCTFLGVFLLFVLIAWLLKQADKIVLFKGK